MDELTSQLRKAAASKVRAALAGQLTSDGFPWSYDLESDPSAHTALIAVQEYLDRRERGQLDDDDLAYWVPELTGMADRLERGDPLPPDQIAGWRGLDLTFPAAAVLALVVLVLVGYATWRLIG